MLWRKRNDGFEWRDYVRTTILVRRKQRRDRIGEAGRAAVDNLKAAGQKGAAVGAEGAKAVGRGVADLGQQSAVMGALGAKALGQGAIHYGQEGAKLGAAGVKIGAAGAKIGAEKVRAAVPVAGNYLQRLGAALFYALSYAWAVMCTLGGLIADYLSPLLAPVAAYLRRPGIRIAALIAGSVFFAGGIIRAFANGFEQDTWIALTIGTVLLSALGLAHASLGLPDALSSPLKAGFERLRRPFVGIASKPSVQMGFAGLVLALILGAALYPWLSASKPAAVASRMARSEPARTTPPRADLEGRGNAVAGDTLRVGATTVRLNGIEAPLPSQTCNDAKGRQWACGEAARQALARMLRSGRVSCTAANGSGDCQVNGSDLAAELVRGGHVFATTGLFAPFGGEEREARAAKAGLWSGTPVRPSEYRELKWEEAKRVSPDGCPIKGNVRRGQRLYLLPWAPGYEQMRVSTSRGERWFCSEAEAEQAGFKSAGQS